MNGKNNHILGVYISGTDFKALPTKGKIPQQTKGAVKKAQTVLSQI